MHTVPVYWISVCIIQKHTHTYAPHTIRLCSRNDCKTQKQSERKREVEQQWMMATLFIQSKKKISLVLLFMLQNIWWKIKLLVFEWQFFSILCKFVSKLEISQLHLLLIWMNLGFWILRAWKIFGLLLYRKMRSNKKFFHWLFSSAAPEQLTSID